MDRRDNALEVCIYGVTDRGEKVCQDYFFLKQPADLNTVFQLVRMRNINVVRIVLDIALPVVNVPLPLTMKQVKGGPVDETDPLGRYHDPFHARR